MPADGADLACWHRPGDGTRWVVWLHGACGNHRMWGRQLSLLDGVDHVFVDVRGQGESTMHVGRRVHFADAVNDIGHILDDYGIERAALVGHSWGGNPCQEFAFRYPDRIAGLVMVGAWGQLRPMSEAELRRIRVMTKLYRFVPWSLVSRFSGRACSSVPETQGVITEVVRATGRDVFLDLGLSAYEAVHDVDSYPVATPTLLVRGSLDAPKALAPIYRGICAKNPAAREVVIEGTRHQPMMDTPDRFDEVVAEFLLTCTA